MNLQMNKAVMQQLHMEAAKRREVMLYTIETASKIYAAFCSNVGAGNMNRATCKRLAVTALDSACYLSEVAFPGTTFDHKEQGDAEGLRTDEGQVQKGRIIRPSGEEESSADLE